MKKQIKKVFNNKTILSLLIITFFCLLSYLPLIPYLGLYGDDWFFTYVGHFYGSSNLIKTMSMERPLAGYSLALNYVLLGNNVFLWHITMLLMRLLGGYILFATIKMIWPKRLSTITSITILFLIYPGFLQQFSPVAYLALITNLTIWIISLGLSILAIKAKHIYQTIIFILMALILQVTYLLIMEYFIGMEILRLLLIAYTINTTRINVNKISLRTFYKTLLYWSPYLLTIAIFVFWRVFIYSSGRETTNIGWVAQTYYSNPFWIITRPLELIYSFLSTVFFAYFIPIIIRFIRIPLQYSFYSFLIGILSSSLLYFYFKIVQKTELKNELKNKTDLNIFGRNLLIIGLLSTLGALFPIIATGRYVRLFYTFDRYTLTSMIGISFLIIGLLNYKIKYLSFIYNILHPKRNLIIIIIIALSVTTHLMNGYFNMLSWNEQKNIWWQLYWRASKIQNNTVLILDFPSLTNNDLFSDIANKFEWNRFYWVDYQIYGPGNLFFNFTNSSSDSFTGDYLEDEGVIKKIRNKTVEETNAYYYPYIKDFQNNRNYNNAVIISTPNDRSCLWVLDENRRELPNNSNAFIKSSIQDTNINKLIQTNAPTNIPTQIFGFEPYHDWCYYFEKASLARQFSNWETILQLFSEVKGKNMKPKDINEWLPFIEGLLISKNYIKAEELIKIESNNNSSIFRTNICNMFSRLQKEDLNNKKISSLNNNFCK